ncbi:MAG TPA: peptide deformylase [Patescibacteria group bacterium]|nr:peptide deformylase [Patescibacteria group bacterium]
MKILTLPHTILTQKSRTVNQIDKKIIQIIDDMKALLETQTNPPGVGMAAPQVGIPLRIFIMKPTKKSSIRIFINPHIIDDNPTSAVSQNQSLTTHDMPPKITHKKLNKLEGCLSLPRIWGSVAREDKICITYLSIEGKKTEDCFTGFESIIIQHELDHLEGIIFTQRVVEQNQTLYEEKNGELIKLTPI